MPTEAPASALPAPARPHRLARLAFALLGFVVLLSWGWRHAHALDPSPERAALDWLAREPALADQTMLIVDFTRPSFLPRGYLFDPRTRTVLESFWVSHGEGSGEGRVVVVSNQPGSHCSSAGAFRAGEAYDGRHGRSRRLHGLEPGVNDRALERAIVIHGAAYASPSSILWNGGRLGRSDGCLALAPEVAERVVDALPAGSLVYVHASPEACAPGSR